MAFLLLGCRDSSSQEDNSPQLPPETQSGANTFGCYVNGKLFYPRDGTPSVGSDPKGFDMFGDPSGSQKYNELNINNYKDGKPVNNMIIHIQFLDSIGTGQYLLQQSNFNDGIDGIMDNYFLLRAYDYNENVWKWYSSYENSGMITITRYDKINYIVSGTFSGKVRTEDSKSEIEITEGRFDINKATLPNAQFP